MYKLAIIGAGRRIAPLVKQILQNEDFALTAICDIDIETAKKRFEDIDGIAYYTDAEEMLKTAQPDGVFVATRCSTHARYACLVAKYNIPMFLEKPVCTTEEDLASLEGILHMNEKTVVSFPLRLCETVQRVKEIIDSGRVGTPAHVQAYNNVYYGRGYYHKWYRDENETGGLLLQKATHDLDCINFLLENINPIQVCAMTSKQVFKGDKPANLRCADCAEKESCPEGVNNINPVGGDPYEIKDLCCFSSATGNEDSSSILVMYDNGLHVAYSQNFIVRRSAGKRGARIISYEATLEFDLYSGDIKIIYHNEDKIETLNAKSEGSHFGGDDLLLKNFADVVRGTDISHADLTSGILSAKMCLMAKKSAQTKKFYDI